MIKFDWLEGRVRGGSVTFGVPHHKGEIKDSNDLIIEQDGQAVLSQNKSVAYWEDGSVKWTAVSAVLNASDVWVKRGNAHQGERMAVVETAEGITVDNGCFEAVFHKSGQVLMKTDTFSVGLKAIKTLVSNEGDITVKKSIPYYGEVSECAIEDTGAVKTVIRIKGTHKSDGDFLRFILRFTVYKNSNKTNIMHTFIYDGEPSTDLIGGIGVCIKYKMSGSCVNRRVKLAGDYGVFHEPLQILNTWRPRLKKEYYDAQMRGEKVDLSRVRDERNGELCTDKLENVTVWDSYKYMQVTPDSFTVKKRTAHDECTYINANFGHRAKGLLYAGDEKGGIAVAMRHFYEKAPSAINADKLSSDTAEVTAWIHPPEAEALDMRHYDTVSHDQTYYEGFPHVGCDPYGVAATNELSVLLYNRTPSDDVIMNDAESVARPAVLVSGGEVYKNTGVLGVFSLPDKSTPLKDRIEDELDKAVNFYIKEVEQRHWYGLFDYGDVMHTYDYGRHCWKYDMGGYAWQNTELVPTLWLWYTFLRSGRGDVFDIAEAMSRHAADVDVYHIGEKKGLGSRHNVIHWGDSCKEPRIAMAGHHRPLYYIMGGDARIGDVFDDVCDSDFSSLAIDPLGEFYKKEDMKLPTHARTGPDWSTYCSNWYTEWERNRNTKYRDKIQTGIDDLKKAPLRMISGSDFEYDPHTGHLGYFSENSTGGVHLMMCMGGPQTWMELQNVLDDDVFRDMLIELGEFYYLPAEEKRIKSNGLKRANEYVYPYMAATMVAYAAKETGNERLAYKVWQTLIHSLAGKDKNEGFDKEVIKYFNNERLEEIFWISTNFTAQWCLNAIVCLELTGEYMLDSMEEYEWEDWVK
ncbi:MAG: hypothetical protein IJ435_05555 [Clostridia bacterium]|nr:hypothetical protein [Clostridia bacterium]